MTAANIKIASSANRHGAALVEPEGYGLGHDRAQAAGLPTAFEVYQFHAAANFLFGILTDAGVRFGQDYNAFVVYSAFLVASAADTLRDVATRRTRSGYAPGVLSAHSVAEMTGIPRETVRRKCLLLEERGLLDRQPTGQFRCAVDADRVAALVNQFQHVQPFR